MSARSQSSIITLVRYLIREATAKTFTDAEIVVYMNLVLDEIHDRVERMAEGSWVIEAADTQNLTANDDTLDIPTGFVRFDKFEVYNGTRWTDLLRMDIKERPSGLTAQDPPTHYTLLGSSIIVTPPPSVTRANAFRVWGGKEPTPYNGDSSTTGLPRKCDRAVAFGAAWMCLLKEGNRRAPDFERIYTSRMERLPSELALRDQESMDPELD